MCCHVSLCGSGALVFRGPAEPLLKRSSRTPKRFTFNDLAFLAGCLHLHDKPTKTIRKKLLLQQLAQYASGHDTEYVNEVLEADSRAKATAAGIGQDTESKGLLVDMLFENIGLDERTEYRELRKRSSAEAKAAAKRVQWNALSPNGYFCFFCVFERCNLSM